jgi:peptidoglycan hydrolase-like protein with peptidoglycan-binding domain
MSGRPTGVFDAKTAAALRQFQRDAGIAVDGRAGPQTIASMRQHTMFVGDNFEVAAKVGQRGRDIRGAEQMLKDLGFNPGKVDGTVDKDTQNAVARFRATDPALTEGQRIDARTFGKLREAGQQPLARGSQTRGVKQLEQNLERLGLRTGTVDQTYTQTTEAAVAAFQRQSGLPVTGVADQATRAAIQQKVDALPTPTTDKISEFDRTAPKSDYARTSNDGKAVNKRTQEMIKRAEFIMEHKFGPKNFDFTITQGSYSTGVAASAGTHDGGGALDMHTRTLPKKTVDDMVKALRMAGFAAWSRGRGHDSFAPHIHAIAIGDRELAPLARSQVQDYFNGRDGLSGHRADPDRGLGRPIPHWARRFDR